MYLREYVPPTQRPSRRQSNPTIESPSKSSSRRRHKKSNRIRRGDNNTSGRSVISQYSIDDDRSNISSARSAPISYSRSQSSCANDVNYDHYGRQQHSRSFNKGRDSDSHYYRSSRRKRRSSKESDCYPDSYSFDDGTITTELTSSSSSRRQRRRKKRSTRTQPILSIDMLSRICSLAIICTVLYLGVGACISLTNRVVSIIFGDIYHDISSESQKEDEYQSIYDEDKAGVRGASLHANNKDEKLNVHDLNAQSHLLKAEGRQIINDKGLEVDEEGEGELEYMGHDITNDFFFAGPIVEKKQPGHAYADIPLLLDSNPFAISIWINLAPLSDAKENNDSRHPRVILSTNSKGYVGCSSDKFGNRSGIGIVLYAQPEYHHSYRIILEYADMTKKSCQTIGGSTQHDELLVREGEWNHITIFATRTSKSKEVKTTERISMYVNGELSGRNDEVSRDLTHVNSENGETIIGRYATPDEPHHSSSNDQHFDLRGRVGMLSFWETGGHARLSKLPTRMSVKTTDDEDHVVKMIQRAAFDIGAIKELSLRGLFVKKPTLLYPFQRREKQKEIKLSDGKVKLPDLSLELPPVANCNELMSGKNGEIIVDIAGNDSHVTTRRLHAKQPVKKFVKQSLQDPDNADEQELDMYRGH